MTKFEYPQVGEVIYRDTLPNGLRLSVMPKPGYSRCHAYFATDYGGADRRFRLGGKFIDTPAGVAHFLEHKMFDMPDGSNALSELAANGAEPNAYTAANITAYYFDCTNSFYENLESLLRFVSTPYFTEESVQKEQGIIAQEIRMYEDEPGSVVFNSLMGCLYEHHPIRDDVAGTVESISGISAQTLYDCHKVFYAPCNMSLCVVGDVDPEKVRATALRLLPSAPGEAPEKDYGEKESLLPCRPRFYRAMEVSAPQFMLGCKIRPESHGALSLRQKLLAGAALSYLYSRSSPFYTRLYGEGIINTDFYIELYHAADTATILAGGESRDSERVLREMLSEAQKAAENGLDKALWSRIKKSAYGARVRALSSFGGLCAAMADADFAGYNCLDSFTVMDSITAEDVQGFIKENILPERFAMSVITPIAKEA